MIAPPYLYVRKNPKQSPSTFEKITRKRTTKILAYPWLANAPIAIKIALAGSGKITAAEKIIRKRAKYLYNRMKERSDERNTVILMV